MGNNAAVARTGGAWRNGVTVALSAEHNKKKLSPSNILLDVVIHNSTDMMSFYSGYTLEKTVKNSIYWKAYRITTGVEEELPYVGVRGETNDQDKNGKDLKPHATVHGEGIKLHECFQFTPGHKYRITCGFNIAYERKDDWESVEFTL